MISILDQDDADLLDTDDLNDMKVHAGFLSSFESIKPQIDSILLSFKTSMLDNELRMLLTGHSMGSI